MEVVDSEISNASAATFDATGETTGAVKVDTGESIASILLRNVHIPYILNGELYEIQSQDGENVTVKCCHCPPDRVYRGSVRSTGNFHMHIKRRHPDLLGKLHDMKVNALLERRERYIKNRKVSAGRNRHISGTSGGRVVKRELAPLPMAPTQQQRPALSLMHTHKLKIKRAFQRHQQLQQQQQLLQHWSVPPFVTTPAPDANFVPINYSMKERCADETQQDMQFATLQSGPEIQANYLIRQTKPSERSLACEIGEVCSPNCQYPKIVTPCLNNEPVPAYADTTAANTPSPSVSSSRGSQAGVSGSIRCRHNTIATTVKNEHLVMPERAVDLSMQASVGSLSSGIGSIVDTLTCGGEAGSNSAPTTASFPVNNSHNTNTAGTVNPKWSELLSQVETSLRDIQHEMRMRNQIETNRIFLDIAKFKYLHPGFNFHY